MESYFILCVISLFHNLYKNLSIPGIGEIMTTVGFSFNKILASKNNVSEANIRVENNVGILNVEESPVDAKKSIIKYEFNFTCKYEPGMGVVELNGELVEMYEKEFSAKVIEGWKKDKKLHPEIMQRVLNSILGRANIEAIVISRELGLPSPIQLPKVELKPASALKPIDKKDVPQAIADLKAKKEEIKKEEAKKEDIKTELKKEESKKDEKKPEDSKKKK